MPMQNIKIWLNRNNLPAPIAPRLNFVAGGRVPRAGGLGVLSTLMTLNPGGAILGVLLGLLLAQSPKDRAAMGTRGRAAPG